MVQQPVALQRPYPNKCSYDFNRKIIMAIMEKKNNYNSPNVEVIDIEIEGGFCQSYNSTHEGTTEEDWDEPLS